jgi:3-hydroxybutyryl-CoA dehydratase
MSEIREKAIAGLQVGDSFVVSRIFTEQDTAAFAEMSRDYNPVHFDQRFAQARNFRGQICHGLLVASLLTEVGGQLGWLASSMHFRFRRPVYFGDTIDCCFTIAELDTRNRAKADVVFKNQEHEVVLEAQVTGIVPGAAEKSILADILAQTAAARKARR